MNNERHIYREICIERIDTYIEKHQSSYHNTIMNLIGIRLVLPWTIQ